MYRKILSIWIFLWIILLISSVLIHSMNLQSTNSHFKCRTDANTKISPDFQCQFWVKIIVFDPGRSYLWVIACLDRCFTNFSYTHCQVRAWIGIGKVPEKLRKKNPEIQNLIDRSEICMASSHHLWLLGPTRWCQNNAKPFFRIQLIAFYLQLSFRLI